MEESWVACIIFQMLADYQCLVIIMLTD